MKRLLTVLALLCLSPILAGQKGSTKVIHAKPSGQHSYYVWPGSTETNAVTDPAQKLQLIEARIAALKAELSQLDKQRAELRKSVAQGAPAPGSPQDKLDKLGNTSRTGSADRKSGNQTTAPPEALAPVSSPVLRRYQEKFAELQEENVVLNARSDALSSVIREKKGRGEATDKEEGECNAIRQKRDKNLEEMNAFDAAIQDLRKTDTPKR
jgi:hypothetical protein